MLLHERFQASYILIEFAYERLFLLRVGGGDNFEKDPDFFLVEFHAL